MSFSEAELTRDDFLGGALRIWQPRAGYRAATDPVFLAAAVPAQPGESVLELGCGAATALCCLCHRVPGLRAAGLELQPAYAALARRNAAENGLDFEVVEGDLADMPGALRARSFDHVLANPPFYPEAAATAPGNAGRGTAHIEGAAGLAAWIDAGLRRLAPRGSLTVVHRAERLSDILIALQGRAGDIRILPLAARTGRPAGRVVVRARKGARAPLQLLAPLVVHAGLAHTGDGDDYSTEARNVLRAGRELLL